MLAAILPTQLISSKKPQRQIRMLGILSIAVPAFIFTLFATTQFIDARQDAELRLNRSLRVAHEHASRIINSAEDLSDRLHDLVDGKSIEDLRADESRLHSILAQKMRDQPQLQSIWIIGSDGSAIATSRFQRVNQELNFRDRDYVQYYLQGNTGRFMSEPMISRTAKDKIINLSLRFDAPDGSFGGIVCVSMMASYFRQFYEDLAADETGLTIRLFGANGAEYTRYPDAATDENPSRFSANGFRKLADNWLSSRSQVSGYPMFVETAMNLDLIHGGLLKQLAIMLAFGLPPFAALFVVARRAERNSRETLEAALLLEQEISTRRKAEDALRQAQKLEALGRLTGGVAHDFNNALTVINNCAFILRQHVAEGGMARLEAISRAVASATKITRQLLAFSRRQALVPEILRLQDRLPLVQDLVAPVLGSQIRVSVAVDADTQHVHVDAAELELALLNLAINARDAMPGGGTFHIHARNAHGDMPGHPGVPAVAITAADNGNGIEASVMERVFEPFFTTKPVGEGTGLGLSQVYGMCQRAGGAATIHSVIGRGTQVVLYFPAAASTALQADEGPVTVAPDLGKRVLLVEDNDEVADSLKVLLEALGCQVDRAPHAAGALQWLDASAHLPDLVLSDVVMPGEMNGVALVRHLRATRPELPLLLMTGYSQQIDDIVEQGFEVLPKPCSVEQLKTAIQRATEPQAV